MNPLNKLFDISGKKAVITGASGVLGSAITRTLSAAGVIVAPMSRQEERLTALCADIRAAGGEALPLVADCMDKAQLDKAGALVKEKWGHVDFLLNFAGGNRPDATTSPERSFFSLSKEAIEAAVNLNLSGTILPCQVFGQMMTQKNEGVILNISSMAAQRPLTRVLAYGSAKAAVDNFTKWLAVHVAKEYSPKIRVNAIAPGFFLTEQNRFLLTDKTTGEPTARGQSILAHTPMGRYGAPEDLIGAVAWLLSPASAFVTGAVIPIDGGFNAFSGV